MEEEEIVPPEEEKIPPILTLPLEVHTKIFENLEQIDTLNFRECSKTCRDIWKGTKCFYESMSWDQNRKHIKLSLNDSYPFSGYSNFIKFSNRYCESIKTGQTDAETVFRTLPGLKVYFEKARNLFVKKLVINQTRIKSLTINGLCPINLQRIKCFSKLQYLTMSHQDVIREVLPKTGNMLKYLKIEIKEKDSQLSEDYSALPEFPEINRVLELYAIDFELTAAQIMNLTATRFEISAKKLAPQDVYNFIRTWQTGERVLEKCVWDLTASGFNSRILFHLYGFEVRDYLDRSDQICIRGNGVKSGRLSRRIAKYGYDTLLILEFEVLDVKDLADENGILIEYQ
ncbi:unnamed protein product [Caenorhabditis angaria]|uniref:F-box domain-containing protein n=1 Tax=Caenorhabditis angaria TaxID=860376 RepID=A0A9P1I7Y6_9PELO|nr:unnamed protein product [Caenorhabditis angaria]